MAQTRWETWGSRLDTSQCIAVQYRPYAPAATARSPPSCRPAHQQCSAATAQCYSVTVQSYLWLVGDEEAHGAGGGVAVLHLGRSGADQGASHLAAAAAGKE